MRSTVAVLKVAHPFLYLLRAPHRLLSQSGYYAEISPGASSMKRIQQVVIAIHIRNCNRKMGNTR